MEGLLDLFECVIESPRHGEYIQEFLNSCTEHQAFYKKKSKCVQQFISFTNSKLNQPSDRLEGLLLLQTFLPQCSDQQFIENAVSWIHQCVKGIESSRCLQTNNVAYSVLKMLLEMTNNFQELTKSIANIIGTKFLDHLQLSQKSSQVEVSALDCIHTLIRNYGAPCSSHKTTIENFILPAVDRKDPSVICIASRCFALLPLIGGAGSSGANHKARWLEQQKRTCGTLQQLLDGLLDGVNEVATYERDEASEILPLDPLVDLNPIVKIHEITNRFVNVCKFLEAMLLHEFPVSKSVLPDNILGVVSRGLSINCTNLGNKGSSDLLTVGSVLPRINVAVLRVLTALIKCLGKNLYPQAKLICRLVVQTLKWTACANHEYGISRPYSSVRVEACHALVAWLRAAKAGSCVEGVADDLVQALSQDVSTEKATVKLSVQTNKKTKKRKLNVANDDTPTASQPVGIDVSARIKLTNQTANARTCQAALDALYWMLLAAGVLVKPTLHKTLQEMVLLVLYDIQRSNKNDLPIPYSEVKCRVALYRLLQFLTLEPHPLWPPPTQFTLHVLARGQTDPSSEVSGFCAVALSSVEKLIHVSSQALQYPVHLEEVLKSVNLDATSTVCPIVLEQPMDDVDAASVSSAGSARSMLYSPEIADEEAVSASVMHVPILPSEVNDDELSDASTVQYPIVTNKNQNKEANKLNTGYLLEKQPKNTDLNASDIEDRIPVSNICKKRRVMNEVESDKSSADIGTADSQIQPKLVDTTEITIDSTIDVEDSSDVIQSINIPDETVPEKTISGSSAKTKVFQRKASGVTSPKLLGGSEISKVTRFNLKPRFVNLADDDDGSIVNLSSDDEFHASNISVVSSNSNYQESILNKSCITNDGDLFEDIEEENEEAILSIHKSQDDPNGVFISIEKTSSVRLRSYDDNVLQRENGEDDGTNRDINIIDTEDLTTSKVPDSNGITEAGEPEVDNNEVSNVNGDDDPVTKKVKIDPRSEAKIGSNTVPDNIEGMTDEEVVRMVFDDFQKKIDG